jgi:hypothetical protein
MNVNVTEHDMEPRSVPKTDAEMLQEVYRRVVRMHSAVVERTDDDTEIVPWTERELRALVRQFGVFWRAKRAAGQPVPRPARD